MPSRKNSRRRAFPKRKKNSFTKNSKRRNSKKNKSRRSKRHNLKGGRIKTLATITIKDRLGNPHTVELRSSRSLYDFQKKSSFFSGRKILEPNFNKKIVGNKFIYEIEINKNEALGHFNNTQLFDCEINKVNDKLLNHFLNDHQTGDGNYDKCKFRLYAAGDSTKIELIFEDKNLELCGKFSIIDDDDTGSMIAFEIFKKMETGLPHLGQENFTLTKVLIDLPNSITIDNIKGKQGLFMHPTKPPLHPNLQKYARKQIILKNIELNKPSPEEEEDMEFYDITFQVIS